MQEDEDPRAPAPRPWQGSPGGPPPGGAVHSGIDPPAALKSVLLTAITRLFQPGAMPGPGSAGTPRTGDSHTASPGSDKPRILLIPDCLSDPSEAKDMLVPDSRPGPRTP